MNLMSPKYIRAFQCISSSDPIRSSSKISNFKLINLETLDFSTKLRDITKLFFKNVLKILPALFI